MLPLVPHEAPLLVTSSRIRVFFSAGLDAVRPRPGILGPPDFLNVFFRCFLLVTWNLIFSYMAGLALAILGVITADVLPCAHLPILVPEWFTAMQHSLEIINPVLLGFHLELWILVVIHHFVHVLSLSLSLFLLLFARSLGKDQ